MREEKNKLNTLFQEHGDRMTRLSVDIAYDEDGDPNEDFSWNEALDNLASCQFTLLHNIEKLELTVNINWDLAQDLNLNGIFKLLASLPNRGKITDLTLDLENIRSPSKDSFARTVLLFPCLKHLCLVSNYVRQDDLNLLALCWSQPTHNWPEIIRQNIQVKTMSAKYPSGYDFKTLQLRIPASSINSLIPVEQFLQHMKYLKRFYFEFHNAQGISKEDMTTSLVRIGQGLSMGDLEHLSLIIDGIEPEIEQFFTAIKSNSRLKTFEIGFPYLNIFNDAYNSLFTIMNPILKDNMTILETRLLANGCVVNREFLNSLISLSNSRDLFIFQEWEKFTGIGTRNQLFNNQIMPVPTVPYRANNQNLSKRIFLLYILLIKKMLDANEENLQIESSHIELFGLFSESISIQRGNEQFGIRPKLPSDMVKHIGSYLTFFEVRNLASAFICRNKPNTDSLRIMYPTIETFSEDMHAELDKIGTVQLDTPSNSPFSLTMP